MKKKNGLDRREFINLAGLGSVVFVSGLGIIPTLGNGLFAAGRKEDFYFLQLSDTHWGFEGPKVIAKRV